MSDFGRVYLDANIFIYVVERRVAVADLLTTLLLGENARALQPLVTSDLTLAETLVHPLRFQNEELIGIYSNWALTNHRLEVGPITREVLYYAATLRAHYRHLKLPDAIHLSTAFGFGCTHFLSDDDRLEGAYELWNTRFGITKGPARLIAMRPSATVLSNMIQALC